VIQLGVNIDHVATLRQARYRAGAEYGEPDVVLAAGEAVLGGADCITVHLREDRRHVVDRDVEILRKTVPIRINLEMGATDEMVRIAQGLKVSMATLVPEGRQEVTTEGGLDVAGQGERMREVVKRLKGVGIAVSAFIDAELPQAEAAKHAGFDMCEVHTGPYARAFAACGGLFQRTELGAELSQLAITGGEIRAAGMRFNAGHALNYTNVWRVAALPGISELHIGHAIVSRAMSVGLREAVRQMKEVMLRARQEEGK
jgi:pyridoxine 5-phosphate synthase